MCSATGSAVVVAEMPEPGRLAVTDFSVKLALVDQTQVGRFTVDVPLGAVVTRWAATGVSS